MRVRARSLVFALALLVLLDVALRLPIEFPVPRDFRLPNRTTMGYDEFLAAMKRDPGVRVAVVGDSIVWGGFAEPWDTLSAHLTRAYEEQRRPVTAYNLGMNGAHANDLLPVIAGITHDGDADVILVNFDMRFFTGSSVTRRYPELYEKAAASLAGVSPDLLAAGREAQARATVEERMDGAASHVWRLYAMRDYLAAAIFGDRPAPALNHAMNRLRAGLFGPPLYGKKPPSRLPLGEIEDAFRVPPLADSDIQIRYLTASLDIARRSGVPAVVFAGPVDATMLDDLGLWDRASYEANLDRVRRIVEAHGGVFASYTDSVPGELIGDSHHPLGAGYEVLAEAISRDIEPIVRRAERQRTASEDAVRSVATRESGR